MGVDFWHSQTIIIKIL